MMLKFILGILLFLSCFSNLFAQEKVFPGADERSPSRSQYYSWINNTNEGATEKQTLANLEFFNWLYKEYGMILDIYAFDAGIIDGKNFYSSSKSERFRKQFPTGLNNIYQKGKSMNTRFGIWGGPDGFGNSPEEAAARKEEMVSLCRDYNWALFKFDGVCGQLRADKEDDFIDLMIQSRKYSPDLILLNHRLPLTKGLPYATTFLWNGEETYIDVHVKNNTTAPHNRVGALARGMVPNLQRLTEDCGVCISSCIDYWEDDLILQAFNRSLILAPEIYGNPWLMNDKEFSKLARIYNLHRKYASILVNGIVLPESYGLFPVSRGNENTRLITLRNLSWETANYIINLNEEIGLGKSNNIEVRQYHPTEKILGQFKYGAQVQVSVPPYRSVLLMASSKKCDEPGVEGVDYEVIKNIAGKPVEIRLLGLPGTRATIKLANGTSAKKVLLDGAEISGLAAGKTIDIDFEGEVLQNDYHRKLATLKETTNPSDASALYEATVYAADNNALEVRSLVRSGETGIAEVKAARDAFFEQSAFVNRGIWDKNLFDGNMNTGFWPSKKFGVDQRVKGGCFRLDLGKVNKVDSVVIRVKDEYALQPQLIDEGDFAEISTDLQNWKSVLYLTGLNMKIITNTSFRYLKLPTFPDCISEIEVYCNGKKIDSSRFRASNLFVNGNQMNCQKVWKETIRLDEVADSSYLSVAINGEHGIEGAYAAIKVDGRYVGAPSRAVSYPSNTWEFVNARSSSNYTYYFPIDKGMIGKEIEVFVLGYDKDKLDLKPEVWISSYPIPFKEKKLVLIQPVVHLDK